MPTTSPISRTQMTHDHRILNFSAGPAILPEPVLKQLQEDIWNLNGSGVGVLEHSHRGKEIDAVFEETTEACRTLAGITDSHEVMFLQNGASGQFAMIPMNFLPPARTADYVITGTWAKKAFEEGGRLGQVHLHSMVRRRCSIGFPAMTRSRSRAIRPICTTARTTPSTGPGSKRCPRSTARASST